MYIPSLKKTNIKRDMRFEEDKALRESLVWEQVGVHKEELLGPKWERHLVSQIKSHTNDKQVI